MVTICDEMRKAVLQAAIQGKLTKQLPEDGNAEDLYKEIQAEKQKLIKEGKIKKEKPLAPISEDEIPFDIPDNWKWVRLSDIGISQTGNTPSTNNSTYFGDDIPFINPGDILNNTIDYNNRGLSNAGKEVARCCKAGSVLQVCIGGSIGKAAINTKEVCFNQQINAVTPIYCISDYILSVLTSNYFGSLLKNNAGGTATPIINRKQWDSLLIPIPPLTEQQRIVIKISDLLARIDEMEKTEQKIVELYKEFPGDIKSSLLQAAMQGKLTQQLEADGDAEELYQQIQQEKQELIKAGKIKKGKSLDPISDDEIPFDIPENWKWLKISSFARLYNGKAFKPSDWSNSGLKIVRIQNLNNTNSPYNYYKGEVEEDFHLYGGELLFAWSGTPGTSFGAHIWREEEAVLNQHIFKLKFNESYLNKKYIMYALNQRIISLIKAAHGSAGLQHVTKGVFESTLIPLPPLLEQQRIVEKLEKLLPMCSSVETIIHAEI